MSDGNGTLYCDGTLNFKNNTSLCDIDIKWNSNWFDFYLFNDNGRENYLWNLSI